MKILITKMHGLGNDFLMIDNLSSKIKITPKQVRTLCDRHKGIGADGVILMEKRKGVDCFMNYYNSDGTLAGMCGNGVRCVARFFLETTKSKKTSLHIDTRAGVKDIKVHKNNIYEVVMGKPVFVHNDFPSNSLAIDKVKFNFVSVGNPHAVAIVDNLEKYDLAVIGKKVENDAHFPNKINVELVERVSRIYFKVRVWERGCGVTLACGTGACAVYAVSHNKRIAEKKINVELPGGILNIHENTNGEIVMSGPATKVFQTYYDL